MSAQDYRWTESYLHLPSETDAQAVDDVIQFIQLRNNINAHGVSIDAARISTIEPSRNVTFVRPIDLGGELNGNSNLLPIDNSTVNTTPDVAWTALLLRADYSSGGYSNFYLSGLPDALFTGEESFSPSAMPAFIPLFNKFKKLLVSGIWGARRKAAPGLNGTSAINTITFDDRGLMTVNTLFNLNVSSGGFIQLSGVKTNLPRLKINGIRRVNRIVDQKTFVLSRPVARTGQVELLLPGVAKGVSYSPAAFVKATAIRAVHHKRGNRGFFSPHGRSASRI